MAPKTFFLALLSTLTLGLAASVPQTDYEVIVIGGGPAGLSAISSLSRVRRRTILFDSGEYRNAPTREMHDVIGNDGTPPADFRGLAREQILKYDTATIVDTAIAAVSPVSDTSSNTTYFRAQDVNGTAYTARKVVLATGLVDEIPDVPGLQEAWGKGVYWCPWCDGYEHRDQPLGILGELPDVVGSVLETHTLNTDVIALVNGTDTPAYEAALASKYPDWRAQLAAWNVTVDNRSIASIERLQDGAENRSDDGSAMLDVFRVWFTDGDSLVRNAFITNYPTAQRSDIPAQLGVKMDGTKIDTADYSGMRTSIAGVFAVGDCNNDGSTNVPHAMFSGKRAGVYIHVEMAREESAAAIGKRGESAFSRREMEKQTVRMVGDEMEKLWKRVLDSRK